ncbi:MAG: hypothetical protein CMJ49_00195 [Planctomycetaceae bacterium]|nr:hypothetical protein [Planctomycetaceae bacterium]
MREDLSKYAKIGLAHFMLWPHCIEDDAVLADTLPQILSRTDIDVIDYCLPFDTALRRQLAQAVRDSGKDAVYVTFPLPIVQLPLGSPAHHHQGINRLALQNQIEAAVAGGSNQMVFATGPDPGPADRALWQRAFADLTQWFCRAADAHQITVNFESFDRETDRKFLYGPTHECTALIESLAPDITNLRLLLDTSHLLLMGESFDHALRAAGPLLGRVHLANCIMADPNHPLFGDRHPPFGYPDSEVDTPQLTQMLRSLLETGYLNPDNRRHLVVEIQPWPGRTIDQTIDDNLERLHNAWTDL